MADASRTAEARRLVLAALDAGPQAEARLSDVIYEAHDYSVHEVHDGFEFDGENDHGYDSDELAAVLIPMLRTARRAAGGQSP